MDERFLILPGDPEWQRIAAFKWLLLPHGLAGAVALLIGPFQFSDRLRSARPNVHRWMGRVYAGSILLVAAPLGGWIGVHFEPRQLYVETYVQAGFWWLTTAIALLFILSGQVARHKRWMMSSYGFCIIFVASRVPDAFTHMDDQTLADLLWSLVVAALVVPDLVLPIRELVKKRRRHQVLAATATPV